MPRISCVQCPRRNQRTLDKKYTRRSSLGIWDVLVEPRVLEPQYFYAMVRHHAFHDVSVVAARLLKGLIEQKQTYATLLVGGQFDHKRRHHVSR